MQMSARKRRQSPARPCGPANVDFYGRLIDEKRKKTSSTHRENAGAAGGGRFRRRNKNGDENGAEGRVLSTFISPDYLSRISIPVECRCFQFVYWLNIHSHLEPRCSIRVFEQNIGHTKDIDVVTRL